MLALRGNVDQPEDLVDALLDVGAAVGLYVQLQHLGDLEADGLDVQGLEPFGGQVRRGAAAENVVGHGYAPFPLVHSAYPKAGEKGNLHLSPLSLRLIETDELTPCGVMNCAPRMNGCCAS